MEIQYWRGAVTILGDESRKVIIFPFDPANCQQCPLALNIVSGGALVLCTGGNHLSSCSNVNS